MTNKKTNQKIPICKLIYGTNHNCSNCAFGRNIHFEEKDDEGEKDGTDGEGTV